MNQATNPEASSTPNAAPAPAKSFEERAADIFGSDADVASAMAETDATQETSAAPPAVESDAVAQARAARRAALAQAKEQERQQVDNKTAVKERDELRKKLATLEEQTKAYAAYIDPAKLTKDQFFQLAEKNPDLSPKELGEWLRERMANPEEAARRAATSAVDPKLQALEKKIAEQEEAIQRFLTEQQTQRQHAEDMQAAHELHAFVQENAAVAPLTARFVAAKGLQGLYEAALSVAQRLPEGAGPQAVLDELEESLVAGQRDYAAIYGNQPTQRQPAFSPPPNQAAAKAPMNVSNTLAQQRSSVVDEQTDFAKLPYAERASRVFDS